MIYSLNKEEITHDTINKYISDYDIFSHYAGFSFELGKVYNSPLRNDNTPSFGIFTTSDGKLMYNDFGKSDSGDVIKFVRLKCNLKSFKEALMKIYTEMVLGTHFIQKSLRTPKNNLKRHPAKIAVQRRNYNKIDKEYWSRFKVVDRKLLKELEIDPVKYVFIDDKVVWIHDETNPIYVIKVYDKLKTYRPLETNKKYKWLGSLTKNHIMGWKQLPPTGNLVIVTKSFKDIAVLKGLGYNAISPSSENTMLPEKVINELKQRFKRIIIFFDNDAAGIAGAEKYNVKHNLENIMLPHKYTQKDIAEFIEAHGTEYTGQLINDLIYGYTEKEGEWEEPEETDE